MTILLLFVTSVFAKSSFNEVRQVIEDKAPVSLATPEAKAEYALYRRNILPQYPVNSDSVFVYAGEKALERAAHRTINERADYYDRLPKLLHPNGVCVVGAWEIGAQSPYTGAFAANTKNLFIGRISVALENTVRGESRGFGFAGKLFPTTQPDVAVETENFFTLDVLTGTKIPRFLDTSTTNEPEFGFDLWIVRFGLRIASALKTADENPGFRPLKNLGSMGLPVGVAPRYPRWMRLTAADGTRVNNENDFRNEVIRAVQDNRSLVFVVEGSQTTKDRSDKNGWQTLGRLRIVEAVVSYGCDRRLHFAHPRLK